MPRKIEVDAEKLVETIRGGADQKEVMQQFGFNNSSQLKVAYVNALMELGQAAPIQKGARVVEKDVSREVAVGKRGSITIPKALVTELGFFEGSRFFVKKTKAGITLSRKY